MDANEQQGVVDAAGPPKTALLVVDMQHDFVDPEGSLSVPGAQALLPTVNALMAAGSWGTVVGSKDWHPPDHISFASNHPGKQVGDRVRTYTGVRSVEVQLFPVHCVAGTVGAELARGLEAQHLRRVIHKGQHVDMDCLSAFHDAARLHSTGLAEYLRDEGVSLLYVCGVATEYCVKATVLDALREGLAVGVVVDAVAAIEEDAGRTALLDMEHAGAALLRSSQLVPVQVVEKQAQQAAAAAAQWEADWATEAEA